MMGKIKVEDVSRKGDEPLIDISSEDGMTLPCPLG